MGQYGLLTTILQRDESYAHSLALLVDDGKAFGSWVTAGYRGLSERAKIDHIFGNAERRRPYTSLLFESSNSKDVSRPNVLCAYTRRLSAEERMGILQLKITIRCERWTPVPVWFTVSIQRDHGSEPRHETDKAHAPLVLPPTFSSSVFLITRTLEWTRRDDTGIPTELGNELLHSVDGRICVWAHTE